MACLTGNRAPFRVVLFSLFLVMALVLQPRSSHANETVDLIVDALAASGAAAGVPIGDTEKDIVKSVIRDVVNNKPILEALKNAAMAPLINGLPPQMQNAANCLARNVNPVECARKELPSAAACIVRARDRPRYNLGSSSGYSMEDLGRSKPAPSDHQEFGGGGNKPARPAPLN